MQWREMRRFKQQLTEEDCLKVLREEWRGVLAMQGENGYPYAIPLDFYYNEEDGKIYFHCAKAGNKIDLLQKDNRVCFTVMDKGFRKEGEWALNIRSVVAVGHVETVEDHDEVIRLVTKLGYKYYPTKEGADREVAMAGNRVNMLAMTIDRMTGKLVNES